MTHISAFAPQRRLVRDEDGSRWEEVPTALTSAARTKLYEDHLVYLRHRLDRAEMDLAALYAKGLTPLDLRAVEDASSELKRRHLDLEFFQARHGAMSVRPHTSEDTPL